MEQIRAFRREDIPRVLELFRAAFLEAGKSVPANLETYFDRVFFESPWYDAELPSYIHLDRSGTIIGFVGVQPRPMVWRGRRVRAGPVVRGEGDPEARLDDGVRAHHRQEPGQVAVRALGLP